MAESPFEVIAEAATLYVAAVGASFPSPEDTPGAGWTKVGTNGNRNYQEKGGVTVNAKEKVELWTPAGATGPVKAFRTAEGFGVSLVLNDLTPEQFAIAFNFNSVTTTPPSVGVAGTKKVGLSRGLNVPQRAVLIRLDASPVADGMASQFEIPVAVQTGEPKIVFQKGEPAGIEVEFQALEDPNATADDERLGRFVVQNTEPGT